jgi:peptidoglycan biosynthesis protein MviN/MurJ (putative lipid II flippase)
MELLFVVLIAAGVGFALPYLLRGRETYGIVLPAAVAAAVSSVVWVGLLWLGFTFDGGWIWAISLVAGGLAALAVTLVVPRRRHEADRALLTKLSGGRA